MCHNTLLTSVRVLRSFMVPAGDSFSTIKVPLSSFSVDWSDYTGECTTKDPTGEQHVCCSADRELLRRLPKELTQRHLIRKV